MEKFTFGATKIRTKEMEDKYTVSGYATIWNFEYPVFDYIEEVGYREVLESFEKGAFSKSITARCGIDKKNAIKFLLQHRSSEILGTPTLKEDETGLYFEVDITRGIQQNEDVIKQIKAGDLKQISVGFADVDNGKKYNKRNDGQWTVKYFDCYLAEISLVTFSANEEAMIKRDRKNENFLNQIKNMGIETAKDILSAMTNTEWGTIDEIRTKIYAEIAEKNKKPKLKF